MIKIFEPVFDIEDEVAVVKALQSGWLNEHDYTREFEKRFAETVGRKYAVSCNNGTVALFMALRVQDIGHGDRVAIPAFTAIGTLNAVKLAGAKPVIVDVYGGSGRMKQFLIPKRVTASIPVHINGQAINIPDTPLVVEDASQALGSTQTRAKVATYSLATSKIITTGQGGMVVTDDVETFNLLLALKDQGRIVKADYYPFEGYNFKFTELQGALGLSQLDKLESRIEHIRHLHSLYSKHCDYIAEAPRHLPWRIECLLPEDIAPNYVKQMMHKHEVSIGVLPEPLKRLDGAIKYQYGRVYLPSGIHLSDDEVEFICEKLKEVIE